MCIVVKSHAAIHFLVAAESLGTCHASTTSSSYSGARSKQFAFADLVQRAVGEGVADLAAFEEDLGGKAFDAVFNSILTVRFALQATLFRCLLSVASAIFSSYEFALSCLSACVH